MGIPFPEPSSKILTREFNGETYVRLRLDIEGAPLHQALPPEKASRALRIAGIKFRTVKPGDYWISIWDHEKAHLALHITAEPDRAREAIAYWTGDTDQPERADQIRDLMVKIHGDS